MTDNVVQLPANDDQWSIATMLAVFQKRIASGEIKPDAVIISYATFNPDFVDHGYVAAVPNVRDAVFVVERTRQDILDGE